MRRPCRSPSSGKKSVSVMLAERFTPFAGSRTLSNASLICPRARSFFFTVASAVKSKVTVPLFSTSPAVVPPSGSSEALGPVCVIEPDITLTNDGVPVETAAAMSSSKS